jgi:hypothetical protein
LMDSDMPVVAALSMLSNWGALLPSFTYLGLSVIYISAAAIRLSDYHSVR